jgi:hypothetical protein
MPSSAVVWRSNPCQRSATRSYHEDNGKAALASGPTPDVGVFHSSTGAATWSIASRFATLQYDLEALQPLSISNTCNGSFSCTTTVLDASGSRSQPCASTSHRLFDTEDSRPAALDRTQYPSTILPTFRTLDSSTIAVGTPLRRVCEEHPSTPNYLNHLWERWTHIGGVDV